MKNNYVDSAWGLIESSQKYFPLSGDQSRYEELKKFPAVMESEYSCEVVVNKRITALMSEIDSCLVLAWNSTLSGRDNMNEYVFLHDGFWNEAFPYLDKAMRLRVHINEFLEKRMKLLKEFPRDQVCPRDGEALVELRCPSCSYKHISEDFRWT